MVSIQARPLLYKHKYISWCTIKVYNININFFKLNDLILGNLNSLKKFEIKCRVSFRHCSLAI